MEDGKSEGPIKDTQKSAPQAVITSSNANQKQTSKETYNQNDKIKPTSSKTVNELNRLEFSVTPSPAGAKEEKQKKPTDINNIQ